MKNQDNVPLPITNPIIKSNDNEMDYLPDMQIKWMTITISKALKEDTTILQENLKNAELNAKVNPIYENRIQ